MGLGKLARTGVLAFALATLIGLVLWLAPPSMRLPVLSIAAFLIVAIACVLLLPARLVARDTTLAELDPEQRANAVNSARTTLVQGLVGLAALTGIFVAWQQLQTDREQSTTDRQQLREQIALTRQGQVAERFTRAVDQLGGEKLEQRLGGIYGLDRIAKESPDGDMRLVVTELLTAYIRQHAPRDPAADSKDPPGVELATRKPDVQAAITVLGRRNYRASDPPLDLHGADLRQADFHGQNLQKASLSGAQLHGANLHAAQLQGAQLLEAKLVLADLGSAQLQGASLWKANLEAVDLSNAQLQGADLRLAKLQPADLSGAQLQMARLSWAELAGAELSKAQLQGADLSEAHLKGAFCNDETIWPDGFDWKKAGVRRSYLFP